jgi:hypothetical protein
MPLAWPTVVRSLTLTGPSGADQHRPAPAQGPARPEPPGPPGALMIVRPFPAPLTLIALSPKFTESTYRPRRSRSVSPDSARSAASLMVPVPVCWRNDPNHAAAGMEPSWLELRSGKIGCYERSRTPRYWNASVDASYTGPGEQQVGLDAELAAAVRVLRTMFRTPGIPSACADAPGMR